MFGDTFVFRAADNGDHVVVDAEPWDTLRFVGFGYDAVADVARHLHIDGNDVTFLDDGGTIRFLDIDQTDLLAMEFEF